VGVLKNMSARIGDELDEHTMWVWKKVVWKLFYLLFMFAECSTISAGTWIGPSRNWTMFSKRSPKSRIWAMVRRNFFQVFKQFKFFFVKNNRFCRQPSVLRDTGAEWHSGYTIRVVADIINVGCMLIPSQFDSLIEFHIISSFRHKYFCDFAFLLT
jgi:hypothetical protein